MGSCGDRWVRACCVSWLSRRYRALPESHAFIPPIADYFKAIVGKDKIRKHFHLASSQLYDQDGSVSSEDISMVIGRSLKEVMIDQRRQ